MSEENTEQQGDMEIKDSDVRINICKSCENFSMLNTCKLCGCFMPLKVKWSYSTCPENKW